MFILILIHKSNENSELIYKHKLYLIYCNIWV